MIYRNNRPIFEERGPMLAAGPLVHRNFNPSRIEETLKEFY
jgi:hypothetical protein